MSTNPDTTVVNFVMAGCPRCGTTWVHKALKDHPQIYLPPQKQTYFFDLNYDKGIDWYMENYSGVQKQHLAVGEIATGYSQAHAVPRLAEHFPHAKIMLAMRDPRERAYSYYQSRAVGHGWKNLREAVAEVPEILEQGKYVEQIEHLRKYYPEDRMLLLFYDDLRDNDAGYLRQILEFLGVDADFDSPTIGQMVQVAAFPRLRKTLRRMKLGPLLDVVSDSKLGDVIRKQLKSRGVKRYPPMDADTREFLTEYFKPYNQRLQSLLGRDLEAWLR